MVSVRNLFIARIIHAPSDMGSLRDGIRKKTLSKFGPGGWRRKSRKIKAFWDNLERKITKLDVDWVNVRIYQDGLPQCGEEARIVREAAERGSRNFKLLKKLMEMGATVEGTEDPDLLKIEYDGIKSSMEPTPPANQAKRQYASRKHDLLRKRDKYIAKRINSTLKEGETGLLFLGAKHRLKMNLQNDIRIKNIR